MAPRDPSRPVCERERPAPSKLGEPRPRHQSSAPGAPGRGPVTRGAPSCVATPPPAGALRSCVPKAEEPAGPQTEALIPQRRPPRWGGRGRDPRTTNHTILTGPSLPQKHIHVSSHPCRNASILLLHSEEAHIGMWLDHLLRARHQVEC